MKKNKTVLLISLLFVVGLIAWFYLRKTDVGVVTAGTSQAAKPSQPLKSSLQIEIDGMIVRAMDGVTNSTDWINSIKKDHVSQGLTVNQAVAHAAIWSLKKGGEIPMDMFGAGEYGQLDYVKANY